MNTYTTREYTGAYSHQCVELTFSDGMQIAMWVGGSHYSWRISKDDMWRGSYEGAVTREQWLCAKHESDRAYSDYQRRAFGRDTAVKTQCPEGWSRIEVAS